MRIILFITLFSCTLMSIYAQDITQNQPDIYWKIIKSENFKIIFPDYIGEEAQRVANTMEQLREPLSKTLNTNMRKWPIILSTNGAMANGYVTLAPKRSEWYSAPPQGTLLGTGEWYNLLAIHEGRHMSQYDKMDRGLTRLLHILFGQSIASGLSALSVPSWYWEGDAVGTETALSLSGRGRIPSFDIHSRTLLLNDSKYNYYKAASRSLKDYYPNHYVLGYHLTTHVKRNYPVESWSQIAKRTARFSLSPFRFSRMLRKETGFNAKKTYNNCMQELDSLWRKQLDGLIFTKASILNKEKKKVLTNYTYARDAGDFIICLKSGMADAYQLVKIDKISGEETRIRQAAAYDKFSYANEWLCWNEYHSDHRYLNQNYSNIVLIQLDSNKPVYLTSKSRYFVPSLSPDGEHFVAVEYTNDRTCELLLFNRQSQIIDRRFPNPENYFIQTPAWDIGGQRIVYTQQKYHGKSLVMRNIVSDIESILIPEGFENIANPTFYKNYVIYESSYSGIDNIYAIDTISLDRYQITSRKFGASMPAVSLDQTLLYFSDYDLTGYDIAYMPLNPEEWIPIEQIKNRDIRYYDPIIDQEQGKSIMEAMTDIPQTEYDVSDYKQFKHILNIHDWSVIPNGTELQLLVSSTDLLNTTRISFGTNYLLNEDAFNAFVDFSYAKYYPVFSGGFSMGERHANYVTDSGSDSTDSWNETALHLDLTIPYVNTKGNWTRQAYGKMGAAYIQSSGQLIQESHDEINGSFIPVNYAFHFSNSYTSPIRDLHPRYHFAFDLNLEHIPFKGDYKGKHLSISSQFFLPGFTKHHASTIEAALEYQHPDNYYFASDLLPARGYHYTYYDQFAKLSLGYELPLLYPDMHLGVLFFLRRISTGVFYDYSMGKTGNQTKALKSASLEMKGNFTVLNFPVYLEAGLRASYRFLDGEMNYSVLFLDIAL